MKKARVLTDQAKRFKIFRKQILKKTQVELSAESKISQPQIVKYENGETFVPTDVVVLFHNIFDMSYEWFYDGQGKPKVNENDKGSLLKDVTRLQNEISMLETRFSAFENTFKKLFSDFYHKEYTGKKSYSSDSSLTKASQSS
jgi:transcriptional regulator with XRE-family HTH domain